jgi:hypothetical protein
MTLLPKLSVSLAALLLGCCLFSSMATAAEFHVASAPATVSGTQTSTLAFTANAGTASCKSVTLSGTQAAKTQTSLDVAIATKECTAFGFIGVTIDWNGCFFRWTANGAAHIVCPSGKPIEYTAPLCTIQVPGQSLPGGATYTTSGSPPNRHIIEHWNFTGLTYIECGTLRTNGTWKGSTTTQASSETWFE